MEAIFSARFVPRFYKEDQLPLWASPSRVRVESLKKEIEREKGSVQAYSCDKCEASSCVQKQFGNPEEGELPPLEANTKQHSEDRDWEH
jgi:hypothetical protein